MITTTLNQIKAHNPCTRGYEELVKSLGGLLTYGMDTPITFEQIYASNGYDDTLWCLRVTDEKYHYLWHHFAVDCAKQVEYLMADERSKRALVVARDYADGKATKIELNAARDAARDAVWDAARDAVWDAARDAVWDVARDVAWAAAWAVAGSAVRAITRDAQMKLLFDYCRLEARPENSVELLKSYIDGGK